jgi:hypothetical protein
MPTQRRPAVPSTPPREPKELAAALRELAAQTEEPTIRIGRRRPSRPAAPDGAPTAVIDAADGDPSAPAADSAAEPAPDPDTAEMRAIIPETPPPVGQQPDPDQPAALGEPDLVWRRGAKVLPAHRTTRSAGPDDRSSTIRGRRVRLWPAMAGAVLVAVAVGLVALLSTGSTPRATPAARASAPASTTIPAPASPVRHRSRAARRRAAARAAARRRAAARKTVAARKRAAARRHAAARARPPRAADERRPTP